MIVSSYLIMPPAIAALVIYVILYYQKNPENRITDLRFLLAMACFGVIAGNILLMVLRVEQSWPLLGLFAVSVALLLAALAILLTRPPAMFR
jgi:hypothetical protein